MRSLYQAGSLPLALGMAFFLVTAAEPIASMAPAIPARPDLFPVYPHNIGGSATIEKDSRMTGLSRPLSLYKIEHAQIASYGVYLALANENGVTLSPVKEKPPAYSREAGEYRECETQLVVGKSVGRFRLAYNGVTLRVNPQDDAALDIVRQGDGEKNTKVFSAALIAAYRAMGLSLDKIEGVYLDFEKGAASQGEAKEIAKSLEEKGTPKEDYKVSEVDDDIILDAGAWSE